jgi:hypothetical protein
LFKLPTSSRRARRLAGALGATGTFGTGRVSCRNGRGCAPFTPGRKADAVLVDFKSGTVGEGADGESEQVTPECVQGLLRVGARIDQGTA